MNNIQGIWGGGHFTGSNPEERFGSGTNKHIHFAMEGNNAPNGSFQPATPGPGVGYGYDIEYKELHERQWDPTFNKNGDPDNKIRDFIRKLVPGSRFKFSKDTTNEIYTIKKVVTKKLYNHTSWRKPYNRYIGGNSAGTPGVDFGYIHTNDQHLDYQSVEQVALTYLDKINDNGNFVGTNEDDNLKNKIVQFGKAHNRRICYIIELDKNPIDHNNPIQDADAMGADSQDIATNKHTFIEFLEPVESVVLSDLSKFPAIWEVDPKKKEVDLDIYYEASSHIPVRLNDKTNELFAPLGCVVEILDNPSAGSSILESWDGVVATFDPGFKRSDGIKEIDYT